MAVKIEWILVFMIVAILAFAYDFKVKNSSLQNQTQVSKNLEFYNISFTKVDKKEIQSIIYSRYGVLYGNVLNTYKVNYKDNQIESLKADNAIFVDDYVYVEGNISLYQKDNFSCFTQSAIYNKKLSILNIPKRFVAKLNDNVIKGKNLIYDIQHKLLKASSIEASLEF